MKNFNLRFLYLFFVALFGYLLFYSYTSEQNIANAVDQEEVSTNYLAGFNESQIHILENPLLEIVCLLYTSPSPRDKRQSRMPSSA